MMEQQQMTLQVHHVHRQAQHGLKSTQHVVRLVVHE